MTTIIKSIYQELSNKKRISIIDIFVSLLVIRMTNCFVNINDYFSEFFDNKIISSITPILNGILHCLNFLIIIVSIIFFISLFLYAILEKFFSKKSKILSSFKYDMFYTANHSIDFLTQLFFYILSIGLFLELSSNFSLLEYLKLHFSPKENPLFIAFWIIGLTSLTELYNRYFRARILHEKPSKITVNNPVEVKIVEDNRKHH